MNARKYLYFSGHRLAGVRVDREYSRLLQEDRSADADAIVKARLSALLAHCEGNVPIYAEMMKRAPGTFHEDPVAYLRHLPILDKTIIRAKSDLLVSRDLGRRKWRFNTSGGSTGEPIRLIQDQAFWDRISAIQLLSFRWAGREIGDPAVWVWGSERDILAATTGWKMRIIRSLANDTLLNAFRMTPEQMRSFLRTLNTRRPRLIIAYAQALYELARFALREGISVTPQHAVMTSAGTLYPFMRETIEDVFACKVFDRYGSREVGDIACECEAHSGLHVFPWGSYVEIVDDSGIPVPDGSEGNIVVTSLNNYAMPLIRYAIGDRGIRSDRRECRCGRRGIILEKIVGRSVDTFRKEDGTLVDGEYFTHLLYFRDWVVKFQIVQKGYRHILYRIVKADSADVGTALDDIREKTRVLMGSDCRVEFEFTDTIAPSPSGKFRYTLSEVHQ